MKKSIKTLLKEIYSDEVNKIKVPVYPYQDKIPRRKMIGQTLFKAAGMIIILGTLGFLLAISKPGELAGAISELSEKYRLSERIPAGIQYIQKVYHDSNNLKI